MDKKLAVIGVSYMQLIFNAGLGSNNIQLRTFKLRIELQINFDKDI